ncbi:MAG: RecX family transcriptional regulator [Sphingomonadales bacterium]|nr:RecX family transcriptional regulator [Sphingomonadales bacterium]
MARRSPPKPRPPLDGETLEQLAIAYLGRYATTRARLRRYLARKLRERGWAGEGEPQVAQLAEKCAELGYVDDRAFAVARAASLSRRGYGARRLDQALFEAGIEDGDASDAREQAAEAGWDAALTFARKRRIGPFADRPMDEAARRKAFAAMMRAGHAYGHIARLIAAEPGIVPEPPD